MEDSNYGAAAAGFAGQLAAGYMNAQASKEAARAQERIAAANIAFQKDIYNQNVVRMDPWVKYGTDQMTELSGRMPELTKAYDYNQFQNGPEYKNMLAQTNRERNTLEAKASASGLYGSGTMANQLQQNAGYQAQQGYQQGFQNNNTNKTQVYNMLNSGVNTGLQAAGQQGTYGTNLASSVGSINMNLGNALASSETAQGNAYANAISGSGNIAMNYLAQQDQNNQQKALYEKYLNPVQPQQYPTFNQTDYTVANALPNSQFNQQTPSAYNPSNYSMMPPQTNNLYARL
jgi:hypothetical protein